MYVDYMEYQKYARYDVMDERTYQASAPLADAIIDNWTMGRVGKAVSDGVELPEVVKAVYTSIIDNLEALNGSGEVVSSFSNGVDDYTFDTSNGSQADRLKQAAIEMLPVEWCSGVAPYEGGSHAC